MSKYNFDKIIDRTGTSALKTDVLEERYGRGDLIPLWVADMDFLSPPAITEAIIKRAEHGIFGYTKTPEAFYESIIHWVENQHNWKTEKEWLSYIPGIVKGIAFVIDCFTNVNDKIIIQPPVYHPFRIVPEMHRREISNNPLLFDGKQYRMDLEGLRNLITEDHKILILSNPHNPGGVVWTREELEELAEICYEKNVLVISDEIHSDLAFEGHTHIPFASVSEKAAQNSLTFMAPTKTFNIAGIVSSYSIVPNNELREKFYYYLESSELSDGTIFAYTATEAAYNHGWDWLQELKTYLWENICFVDEYLQQHIPAIKAILPQASYLLWLDCRELKLDQSDLVDLFVDKARLALNDGAMFGQGGEGFMRMNIASPRSVLEKAMDNLKNAVDKLNIQ